MSRGLATKTSSRAGRFKKKLVSSEELLIEAPIIEAKLAPIIKRYESQQLKASEFAAIYLITILSHRFPGTWLGAKRPSLEVKFQMPTLLKDLGLEFEPNIWKRLQGINCLGELFSNFAFKSTPETVNRSILSWSNGDYGLELMFTIPTPAEVLDQQKRGRRCVTVLTKSEQIKKYILGERDALSFTMHDLIHADHFYFHNESYLGQLGFYGLLDFCLKQGHFDELLNNKKFRDEFEYLISDMNAYAIHLLKCLKSALTFYHPEGQKYFENWISSITNLPSEAEALFKLNHSDYDAAIEDEHLLNCLERYKVQS